MKMIQILKEGENTGEFNPGGIGYAPEGLRREANQDVGSFLGRPFFCRRSPHSEAFFTSDIQTVSGIRYEEAPFFL